MLKKIKHSCYQEFIRGYAIGRCRDFSKLKDYDQRKLIDAFLDDVKKEGQFQNSTCIAETEITLADSLNKNHSNVITEALKRKFELRITSDLEKAWDDFLKKNHFQAFKQKTALISNLSNMSADKFGDNPF